MKKVEQITDEELVIKFSRSAGPGGQNVNKVNTRATVFFDVVGSNRFTENEKKLIARKLRTRINKEGVLYVFAQKHRTQNANKKAAVKRLKELLTIALTRKPVRRKTRVPFGSKQKRLEEKRKRGILKRQRSRSDDSLDY